MVYDRIQITSHRRKFLFHCPPQVKRAWCGIFSFQLMFMIGSLKNVGTIDPISASNSCIAGWFGYSPISYRTKLGQCFNAFNLSKWYAGVCDRKWVTSQRRRFLFHFHPRVRRAWCGKFSFQLFMIGSLKTTGNIYRFNKFIDSQTARWFDIYSLSRVVIS